MKFHGEIDGNSKARLIIIFLASLFTIPVLVVAVEAYTGATPPANNLEIQNVVSPMEMKITSLSPSPTSSQVVVVNLEAYNNMGLDPSDANATVTLTSLQLSLNYSYESSNGEVQGTLEGQPTTSLALSSDQKTSFTIDVSGVPSSAGAVVQLTATGTYTWQMDTNTVPVNTVVNGHGTLVTEATTVG